MSFNAICENFHIYSRHFNPLNLNLSSGASGLMFSHSEVMLPYFVCVVDSEGSCQTALLKVHARLRLG